MTRTRRLLRPALATSALVAVAGATLASAAGTAPVDLAALRAYVAAHGSAGSSSAASFDYWTASMGVTPRAACAPGSRPETGRQGRVPRADYTSGRAARGYTCNATDLGHFGNRGGFQVHRYVDRAGRECAIYDSTLIFPRDVPRGDENGTYVLDMTNPAKPVRTAVLSSPAMVTPHESLRLNAARGLLVASAGSATTQVGFVDVWDLSADCRRPVLRSSLPLALLGHEGGLSPDGMTYWATTTSARGITAIDLTDPSRPSVLWRSDDYAVHGLSLSADGNRAYLADVTGGPTNNFVTATTQGGGGLRVLDVSEVQARRQNPTVREVSYLSWPEVTIPQNSVPVTIAGRKYLVQFDEYDTNVYEYEADENVGGIRLIDITDERRPRVVSRIRLAVWERDARADQADDPGATNVGQGYAAHYCSVPREVEPGILACSAIASGLRVFDIRDPLRPREVAYVNHPATDLSNPFVEGAYAMSAPAFVPERREIWYSDANTGFWSVRLSTGAWPAATSPGGKKDDDCERPGKGKGKGPKKCPAGKDRD